MERTKRSVTFVFGTRPEGIKLAPVIQECRRRGDVLDIVIVNTGQHEELLRPVLDFFSVPVNLDLRLMRSNQTLAGLTTRIIEALDKVFQELSSDYVVVQGDTTSALAGALAAFHQGIPVFHVEAGLRSHDLDNPFPEEANRRLITQLAKFHFAATAGNRRNLLNEGVGRSAIVLTGNPVVDSLCRILTNAPCSPLVERLLEETHGLRRVVVTTHRRESFGAVLERNLCVLKTFVAQRPDVALILPVHPNPQVRAAFKWR